MKHFCRLCGLYSKERNAIHLFNIKILLEENYNPAEMINLVFKEIQINEHDDLPKEICSQCFNQTLLSFQFHNTIKKSEKKFMEILKQKHSRCRNKYKLILPHTEDSKPILTEKTTFSKTTNRRRYNCYECPQTFCALRQLKKHHEKTHYSNTNLCNFCNIWFDRSTSLQQHILKYHENTKYKCIKCKSECFTSQCRLFNHYKKKHTIQYGLFQCFLCEKDLLGRKNLERHIQENHLSVVLKNENLIKNECLEDDIINTPHPQEYTTIKKNDTDMDLKNEILIKNECLEDDIINIPHPQEYTIITENDTEMDFKNECLEDEIIHPQEYTTINKNDTDMDSNKLDEVMDVEFLDEFFLNQHSDNSFEFNECWDALGLSFEDDIKMKMYDLANEMFPQLQGKDVSGNKFQYQCPHCKKGFFRQIGILIHLAHDHNMSVLCCDICPEKFSNLEDHKMHRITHLAKNFSNQIETTQMEIIKTTDNLIYKCKYCHKKYKEKCNFVLHDCNKHKFKTDSDQITIFMCDLCDGEFPSFKDMQFHKNTFHLNNQLCCVYCNKKFKTSLGLKYHLKAHIGVKSIECPFCDKKLLTKVNLNAHIKAIHSVVKYHLCTLCDRNFATLDHLKKHVMSVHQKERPHLCSVCGKLFSQVSHLKSHCKIHNTNNM